MESYRNETDDLNRLYIDGVLADARIFMITVKVKVFMRHCIDEENGTSPRNVQLTIPRRGKRKRVNRYVKSDILLRCAFMQCRSQTPVDKSVMNVVHGVYYSAAASLLRCTNALSNSVCRSRFLAPVGCCIMIAQRVGLCAFNCCRWWNLVNCVNQSCFESKKTDRRKRI